MPKEKFLTIILADYKNIASVIKTFILNNRPKKG